MKFSQPDISRTMSDGVRIQPDEIYSEGAIVRICLENIMTFDSVEFKCGPRLNIVIGPNGTGKSTIVCAICLGLAGKTSLLGRAGQPIDFIKYGKTKAKIELELYNPDGDNWKIAREISKQGSPHTKWSVNGRQATQNSIEKIVRRLHIQVGNLTQFLPQEKVADFAKMSESELLENTEKAVGDPEMFENHQKLNESQASAKSIEQEHEKLAERLNKEQQLNSRIEQDVKNFEEREDFLEKITFLNMKKTWIEYEEKRQLYIHTKSKKEQKQLELKLVQNAHAPLLNKLAHVRKQKESLDLLMKNKTSELKDVAKKCEANGKEVDNLTDKFVEAQDELKIKKDQEESRKKRLKDVLKQLEGFENELKNSEDIGDIQPQLEKVNKSMREITQKMGQLQHQGDTLKAQVENHQRTVVGVQKDLKILRNIENQRLELLRGKHKDTYDAVMWLRENKHIFKGSIHEPIMLCVNMKEPHMAKYLENHISFNDMRAFVCENGEDMNFFMDKMREEQNLRINAVNTPSQVKDNFQPRHPIEFYRKYGFHSYLQDLFTCPDAVMKFLCTQYRVQNIPVGDKTTKNLVDKIVKEHPDLLCFYTLDNMYTMKKSRYDGSVSSRSVHLKNASLLTVSTDENRERELVHQLEAENEDLHTKTDQYKQTQLQFQQMEREINKLREEKKQLIESKNHKTKLQSQIESKKQMIQNVESEVINLETAEEKFFEKIKSINSEKHKNLKQYHDHTEKCLLLSTEKVQISLQHAEANSKFNMLEADIREQSVALQQAEAAFDEVKARLHQCKDSAKRLLEIAKHVSGIGSNEELPNHYKQLFTTMPNTVEEIDAKIHEHQVRADCTVQTDKKIVDEYRKRKEEIRHLEELIHQKECERSNHQTNISKTKAQWLQPLQALIARINQKFSFFFSQLKCVGEVDLHVPDNPEDYSKYGIRIKVKFRDSEQLRELSPFHQSGGERSVTTVLYMMALQELAKCPFRCVDEINQGMDPVNERKIFELVVRTVCKESVSQYFLLTPKLLPDLEYDDNVMVLCVYNGPCMISHTNWKLNKFIKKRSKIKVD